MEKLFMIWIAIILATEVTAFPDTSRGSYPFPFVSRAQWGARPPRSTSRLNTPVPDVIIHHTAVPGACSSRNQCAQFMRSIQTTHQDTNGWADIGYNFAVGGDGAVYEGRGWQALGAHASGHNALSIGIVFIGNFVSTAPPAKQIETAKQLIAAGVNLGYIRNDYRLLGHRQVGTTECPGQALFLEIQTWPHYNGPKDEIGEDFTFVSREAWGASPPRFETRLVTPVPFVVIHHTYIPGPCLTREQCSQSMRSMQSTHQNTNGWADIGYNFAVGGDGAVYEGRGWQAVGAHATGHNVQSIGIALIGDFVSILPPAKQMETVKQLITSGVNKGFIRRDYRLIGHRQVSATECPGQALFNEIQRWDQFSTKV